MGARARRTTWSAVPGSQKSIPHSGWSHSTRCTGSELLRVPRTDHGTFRTQWRGKDNHHVHAHRYQPLPQSIFIFFCQCCCLTLRSLSVLLGLYSSTSGTAIVNGYDINTNIENIRGSLGLCPQHNMLFPNLTVREHLFFFGMVRKS